MQNQMQNQMFNQPQMAPEPQQTQQPHSSKKYSFVLDDETYEILSKTYPESIPSLINIAIKRFSESKEYQKYYLKKEFRDQGKIESLVDSVEEEVSFEDQQSNTIASNHSNPPAASQQTAPAQSSPASPISVAW